MAIHLIPIPHFLLLGINLQIDLFESLHNQQNVKTIIAHIDTGAEKSALDIKSAESLNLKHAGATWVRGFGGKELNKDFYTTFVAIKSNTNPIIHQVTVFLNDFSEAGFQMILGRDFLQYCNLSVSTIDEKMLIDVREKLK